MPVLVCGETQRGDDAAAIEAVAHLSPAARAVADIRLVGQLDLLTLLGLPADRSVVVVDAVAGIEPGEVWVRPLTELIGGTPGLGRATPRSSHELPPDQVLALASALRRSPPNGTFVGLGGGRWDLGAGLSPAVDAALPEFARAIERAILDADQFDG